MAKETVSDLGGLSLEVATLYMKERQDMIKGVAMALSYFLSVAPAFAGVSIGMSKAAVGICQASTIRNDLMLTLIPCAFITAMIIYAVIIHFVIMKRVPVDVEGAFKFVAATAILGVGTFCGSVGLGNITRVSIVPLAQQKKFMTSFFLLHVFTEFVGLFAFVIVIILVNTIRYTDLGGLARGA